MKNTELAIYGQIGNCGSREVFMAFESASVLSKLSFADIFDENTGSGYQRRFNRDHSLGFKKYIHSAGATTIPLTFNLRPEFASSWRIERNQDASGRAVLFIASSARAIMAQVDCQHRLGFLSDSPIQFAFMAYLGLSIPEEMAIFRDINGKAKGLSSSLLDLTEAKLNPESLHNIKPELYQAMQLAENPKSPWYQKLDRGGNSTVGSKRIASLRTMQQAVRRFLKEAQLPSSKSPQEITEILISFWLAVAYLLKDAWQNPRHHLLNKSIGVYSLMSIAGDFVKEALIEGKQCTEDYFIGKLSDFVHLVDWTSNGALKGYGGVTGADAALELLRHTRLKSLNSVNTYGKQEYSFN